MAVGFNPYKTKYTPTPPLNSWELNFRGQSPEAVTADINMLTQGPDISISLKGLSDQDVIEIGKKLVFYAPFIAVFSFNSPFYEGKLWKGYSARSFVRNPYRPSVLVFVRDKANLINQKPSLTEECRIECEAGRIEFKAIDSVANLEILVLYRAIKGLVLDTRLKGRSLKPN